MAQNATAGFDYYAELQVAPTASLRKITASYHRLARLHHPDRNPRNEERATVSFQRLQQAYETLSDAAKRAHYDDLHLRPPAVLSSPPTFNKHFTTSYDGSVGGGDEDEGAGESFDDELSENEFSAGDFGFSRHFQNVPPNLFATAGSSRTPLPQHPESLRPQQQQGVNDDHIAAFNRDMLKAKKWRKTLAAKFEVEYRQQYEGKIPSPPKFIKKRAEFAAIQTMIALLAREQEVQEQRWRDLTTNAAGGIGTTTTTSKEEEKKRRQASCLHSYLCTKLYKADNFRCAACRGADGMWAYECPYCNTVLCVSCSDDFVVRRAIEDIGRQVLAGH